MFTYLSKVFYILSERRKSLLLLLFSFLLVSILETFGIGLIGPFVSLATTPNLVSQHPALEWLYQHSALDSEKYFIALLGLLIVVIFCIKSLISWRVQTNIFTFSCHQEVRLRAKLMHNYLEAPYTFHLNRSSSDAINNMLSETFRFSKKVLIPLLNLIANTVVIILLVTLLSITSFWTLAAILVLALPLVFLLGYFRNSIAKWGKQGSQSNQEIVRIINHGLGGIKETKVIGCSRYFEEQLLEKAQEFANATSAFYAFRISPRIIIENLLIVFLIGFTSVFLILNQDITSLTSILSVFAVASIRLIPAASNIAGGISTIRNSNYTVTKLYSDLKELENLSSSSNFGASGLSDFNHYADNNSYSNSKISFVTNLVLDNVTYFYPNTSQPALKNLSLQIRRGESIGFIGKSGAGKTTLVDVILGLLTPQEGDIRVDGVSAYRDLRSWQNLIGYIPQSIFLIEDTIQRNIAFGVPDHLIDGQRLNQAIQAAQLAELVEELPDGIHTMVGERGVRLSGGQRQRVGIARALYHQREILVLDEATAALDNETESLVTEAIKSLSGSKTIIIIAHRLTTVAHCDRIYAMEKGQIVNVGSYQKVVLS